MRNQKKNRFKGEKRQITTSRVIETVDEYAIAIADKCSIEEIIIVCLLVNWRLKYMSLKVSRVLNFIQCSTFYEPNAIILFFFVSEHTD